MFFFQFLEAGDRWREFLADCPLDYTGNRGSGKLNVMGMALLSILCGHWRYAHISSVRGDTVNAGLLGMDRIVSEDVVRTALKRMEEHKSLRWVQGHILASISPALALPWILDIDTTVKCLYGHQEGAQAGHNPTQAGTGPAMCITVTLWPTCASASGWMCCRARSTPLRTAWTAYGEGWEAAEAGSSWAAGARPGASWWCGKTPPWPPWGSRSAAAATPTSCATDAHSPAPWSGRIAVLVTSLDPRALPTLCMPRQYRDRGDAENNYDELRKQWGWCGYTTKKLAPSRIMASLIALFYNWWNLYVRFYDEGHHREAITSRRALMQGVARQVQGVGSAPSK